MLDGWLCTGCQHRGSVEQEHALVEAVLVQVRVAHRHLDILVAEQLLHREHRGAAADEFAREAVSERVPADGLDDGDAQARNATRETRGERHPRGLRGDREPDDDRSGAKASTGGAARNVTCPRIMEPSREPTLPSTVAARRVPALADRSPGCRGGLPTVWALALAGRVCRR